MWGCFQSPVNSWLKFLPVGASQNLKAAGFSGSRRNEKL